MAQIRFHYVRFRTICHPSENPDRVREAIQNCSSLPLEITEEAFETHHGANMRMFFAELTRAQECREVLQEILSKNPQRVIDRLETLMDEDGVIQVRIPKQDAYLQNVKIAYDQDGIIVQFRPMAHPWKREVALESVKTWLESFP